MSKIPFNSITTSLLVGFVSLLLSSCGGGSSDSAGNNPAPTPTPAPTNTDPLLAYQWSIQNVGASAFSSVLPVAGNDMNVAPAWALGYTGKGIKVGIIDSGLDIRHEDLAANVDIANSYNFADGTNDPTPTYVGSDHGTKVAGIIGAVAFNGLGGRGVAYNARLRGYNKNWKAADGTTPLATIINEAKALGTAPYSADNDIFNASYGDTGSIPTFNLLRNATFDNLRNLRGGKGALLVKSAGNGFISLANGGGADARCEYAKLTAISCDDTNADTASSHNNVMIVGASNANGIKSSYSTAGASVWISAPGGEYGLDQPYFENPISSLDAQPAIVTTSLTGCKNDFNSKGKPIYVNDLDSHGESPFAKDCQYTATFNGTSAAAPNATGVVALMLEANPNLGYRDIKHILATTAKRIHPSQEPVIQRSGLPFPITLEQGWVQNSAGNWFSNWYGFGAINAGAAVNMAKSYVNYLPALKTELSSLTVPSTGTVPNTANGAALPFDMRNTPINTIEHVQVGVNIAQAPVSTLPQNRSPNGLWCNQIELTSPSGTKSILMHALQGTGDYNAGEKKTYPQKGLVDAMFLSNAFYGEPAKGTWVLRVLDICTSTSSGTTIAGGSQQLLILNGI